MTGPPPGWAPGPPRPPGPPAGWYPPYPAWRRPTNTTAVLALVFAFVVPPAGLVLGLVARSQVRRTGEEGDGLALAGAIVGGIGTAVYALLVVVWLAALASLTGSFAP